jgi:hypothetical protein
MKLTNTIVGKEIDKTVNYLHQKQHDNNMMQKCHKWVSIRSFWFGLFGVLKFWVKKIRIQVFKNNIKNQTKMKQIFWLGLLGLSNRLNNRETSVFC